MSKKLPAIQFYTGDWLKDPDLSKCSPGTRGIWIDGICAMHEDGRRGVLSGTPEQLARICRCSPDEIETAANELKATNAATVTIRNGVVTLVNRRMQREEKVREMTRKRVSRHRARKTPEDNSGACNENVMLLSSSSSSASAKTQDGIVTSSDASFTEFWRLWPRKEGEQDARKVWEKLAPDSETFGRIIKAVRAWSRSDQWAKEGGRFVPGAAKWLAGRRWHDELLASPESDGCKDLDPETAAEMIARAFAVDGGRP